MRVENEDEAMQAMARARGRGNAGRCWGTSVAAALWSMENGTEIGLE
jgi:hypothetical protein